MAELALVKAISSGRLVQVKILLKMGIDVNYRDQHGQTPLIHALFLKDPRVRGNFLRTLLQRGALVSPLDSMNMNAIMWASNTCTYEDFALLLRHADVDVNFNAQNSAGQTALWLAMEQGQSGIVKELLQELSKSDLIFEVPDHQGVTPAMRAAALRNYDCLQAMIAHIRNATKTTNNSMSISKINAILRSEREFVPKASRFVGDPCPSHPLGPNTPRPPTFTESPRPPTTPRHSSAKISDSPSKPGPHLAKSATSFDGPRPVSKPEQGSLRSVTFSASPASVNKSGQSSRRRATFVDTHRTINKSGQSSPRTATLEDSHRTVDKSEQNSPRPSAFSDSPVNKGGQNTPRISTVPDSLDPMSKSRQKFLKPGDFSESPQPPATGTSGSPAVPAILITTPSNQQWQDRAGYGDPSTQRHRSGGQPVQPSGHSTDPSTENSTPLLSRRQSPARSSQQWSSAEQQQPETNNERATSNTPRRRMGQVSMATPIISPERANDNATAPSAPPAPSALPAPQKAIQKSLVYLPHHELRLSSKPKGPVRKQNSPHPSTTESKESIKRSLNLKVETIKWTRSSTSPSLGKNSAWGDGVFTPSAKDMAGRKKPPSIAHDVLPMLFNLSAQQSSDSFRKPAVKPMPRRRKRTVTRWTKLRSIALISRGLIKSRVRKTSGLGFTMPTRPKSPAPSSLMGTLGLSLRPKSPRPASLSAAGSPDAAHSPTSPSLSSSVLPRRKISGVSIKA